MPWGVHSEFTEEEGPEVEIDEDGEEEKVDRGKEGSATIPNSRLRFGMSSAARSPTTGT